MENEFTKRKAIGTFMGAAIGIFLLELLEHTGNIGWWQVLLAVIFSIEIGCWVGVPLTTRDVHGTVFRKVFAKSHIPYVWSGMAGAAFIYIHWQLFSPLVFVADLTAKVITPLIGVEFSLLRIPYTANSANIIAIKFLLVGVIILMLAIGLIHFIALVTCDWAPAFFRVKRNLHEYIFLAIINDIVLLVVYFIAAVPVMLMVIPVFAIIVLLIFVIIGCCIFVLAGKHQTWAVVFGVMIGILAGAAMGWTHLVLLPTITAMSIGGCVGAGSGYVLTKVGKALIIWDKKMMEQAVTS